MTMGERVWIYYSQTTSVRHGGGEFGVSDPLHAALHDGDWRDVSLWTLSVWCKQVKTYL